MKIEVKVPTVGESITSGVLSRWLVKNNDMVSRGDSLFEIETDKVNVEVPSPGSGKIELLSGEGDEVKIGQIVGYIDTDFIPEKSGTVEPRDKQAELKTEIEKDAQTNTAQKNNDTYPKTSPSVRRIAEENNIDLKSIKGTGKDSRITREDVLRPSVEPEHKSVDTVVAMSPLRRTIAKNLLQAKREAAHLTTFNEINMEHVVNIRAKYKDDFHDKYGIKLGFMSFFIKASCQALKEYPEVNSMVRGDEIVFHHYYNIGVAVSVDEGLIVPVIKKADTMSFADIEISLNRLAQKAREKKITLDDFKDGTFTITNGGVFGSMLSTPIPNYPQTAILGMHSIKDRPYVVEGKIEIKPIMYVALTYDHRVIDGKEAVEFLISIKKYIEDPEKLLIEL